MNLIVLTWWLFFVLAPNSTEPSVTGPLATEAACNKVHKQIVETFRPHRAACIEIPQQ